MITVGRAMSAPALAAAHARDVAWLLERCAGRLTREDVDAAADDLERAARFLRACRDALPADVELAAERRTR